MKDPYQYVKGKRLHIALAEWALGHRLPEGAVVHHVDGNGHNNETTNLVICPNQKYHALLHRRTKALEESGNADNVRCKFCCGWGAFDSTWGKSSPKRGDEEFFHRACVNEYNAECRAVMKANGKRWW